MKEEAVPSRPRPSLVLARPSLPRPVPAWAQALHGPRAGGQWGRGPRPGPIPAYLVLIARLGPVPAWAQILGPAAWAQVLGPGPGWGWGGESHAGPGWGWGAQGLGGSQAGVGARTYEPRGPWAHESVGTYNWPMGPAPWALYMAPGPRGLLYRGIPALLFPCVALLFPCVAGFW